MLRNINNLIEDTQVIWQTHHFTFGHTKTTALRTTDIRPPCSNLALDICQHHSSFMIISEKIAQTIITVQHWISFIILLLRKKKNTKNISTIKNTSCIKNIKFEYLCNEANLSSFFNFLNLKELNYTWSVSVTCSVVSDSLQPHRI